MCYRHFHHSFFIHRLPIGGGNLNYTLLTYNIIRSSSTNVINVGVRISSGNYRSSSPNFFSTHELYSLFRPSLIIFLHPLRPIITLLIAILYLSIALIIHYSPHLSPSSTYYSSIARQFPIQQREMLLHYPFNAPFLEYRFEFSILRNRN